MTVVKNINNNVAICRDSCGREAIVLGRGVGFVKPPKKVPSDHIQRIFYETDERYLALFHSIPPEVITFTDRQITELQPRMPYALNLNLVLTLAEHLSFVMERAKRGSSVPLPPMQEFESGCPLEVKAGQRVVSELEREFRIKLPAWEALGVAMCFLNARSA